MKGEKNEKGTKKTDGFSFGSRHGKQHILTVAASYGSKGSADYEEYGASGIRCW